MKEFFKNRILFVSTYDVAFGDFMTNSLITNYITDHFNYKLIFHYLISDSTSERVSWFIEKQNISDRTFIHSVNTKFNSDKFKLYPPDYYDYIIIDHCYSELDDVLNYFKPKDFLSVHNYPNHPNIKNLYSFFNIDFSHKPNYSFGYDFNKLETSLKEVIVDDNYILLFPFSTRSLASINLKGIIKINDFAKSKGCKLILAGIDANVYPFNDKLNENLKEFKTSNLLDDNIINLMGLSTSKLIYLANKSKYVFYGPTGSCVLPILGLVNNKNNYIISGGDSNIAMGVCNSFPDAVRTVKNIKCNCVHFPCDRNLYNIQQNSLGELNYENLPDKIKNCYVNKHPICLNEELEINL